MAILIIKLVSRLRPTRTWFQFRLRTLFVLVGVAAVPCVWLAWKREAKQKERAAVAAIKKLGGFVLYDWDYAAHKEVPPGPGWVRTMLGEDFFAEVTYVATGMGTTDSDLSFLDAFPGLVSLSLDVPVGTDAGFVHLKRLRSLEIFLLSGAGVTDAGLVHVEGLNRLDSLYLINTGVTDSGLMHLKALVRLRCLVLDGTPGVTDVGLVHLKPLTRLEQLSLLNTNLTDAGLIHLMGMTKLTHLVLGRNGITDAGVADLQKLLPNCKIIR